MDVEILARIQFALTISFHYIFPPLSIGVGVMLVLLEGMYLRTGDKAYEILTRFWIRIFALIFGLGVATGIVMEFQFGTNWAAYSRHVGDIFGSALAAEGIFSSPPDQVIVNEYMPGQGIAAHIDCTPCFEDTVVSLSLGSACVMNFTQLADPTQRYDQLLERGSAVVLQNAARFEWQHGIKPLKSDTINGQRLLRQRRVSLTFRKVKL